MSSAHAVRCTYVPPAAPQPRHMVLRARFPALYADMASFHSLSWRIQRQSSRKQREQAYHCRSVHVQLMDKNQLHWKRHFASRIYIALDSPLLALPSAH